MSRAPGYCRPVVVTLLFVALSACGGESNSSGAQDSQRQSKTDACALLTAAEIEAATGIVPGKPVDASQGALPICNWPAADGSNAAFLTALVAPSGHYGSYEKAMEKWAESAASMDVPFEAGDYEEVRDVGDFGAWLREAGMLQAHAGGTMVQITTRVVEGVDQREASLELARQALARIR